jgi:predicted DsbA family dithiol-disulfide isomerase
MPERITIYYFHDVLCGYCTVAAERLRVLEQEFGDALQIVPRSYPLRPEETILTDRDLKRLMRHVRSAAREPEGRGMTPSIWREDPPRSSMPPLIASEAARLQGPRAQDLLLQRLRTAAFFGGINVARTDVILEAAASVGLDMARFSAAFNSDATRRAVELSLRDALQHGVRAIPAIAIGDEWLMTGLRDLSEYREVLLRWLQRGSGPRSRVLH